MNVKETSVRDVTGTGTNVFVEAARRMSTDGAVVAVVPKDVMAHGRSSREPLESANGGNVVVGTLLEASAAPGRIAERPATLLFDGHHEIARDRLRAFRRRMPDLPAVEMEADGPRALP